jgi:hypothetical protein
MGLLEVLSIAGTLLLKPSDVSKVPDVFQDPILGVSLEFDDVEVSPPNVSQPLEENPPSLKVSPIKGSKDRFCHDAILSLPDMNWLHVGFDVEKNCLFLVEVHHHLV